MTPTARERAIGGMLRLTSTWIAGSANPVGGGGRGKKEEICVRGMGTSLEPRYHGPRPVEPVGLVIRFLESGKLIP